MKLIDFPLGETARAYPPSPALPAFASASLGQQRVDAHCLVLEGGDALARASLWWKEASALAGEKLGVIGHFAALDAASAGMLLQRTLHLLAEQGCTRAVGPMDGNTWRRYRFVTEPGSEPAFFLEPENPQAYPHYFHDAGFSPLSQYSSALVTDLTARDERIPKAIARLESTDVRWRPLKPDRFEDELRAIYRLSAQSFTQNFLYTPISEAEFLAQYAAVAPYVRPELTLMAEQEGELLGYLFGIPDLSQAQRGEAIDTFIIKTVTVLSGRRSAGLGSVLVAESQRIAHELGFRRAIHALMHESNQSRNISAHYAHTMRRYTLYQHNLESTR